MRLSSVIIPTTGSETLKSAVESVFNQSGDTQAYIVIDGYQHKEKVADMLYDIDHTERNYVVLTIPENVGANGFYGHRVYASIPHLINSKYVFFLDQDCWFEKNHVESMIDLIEKKNIDWAYCLRNIVDKSGKYICKDDCESLGKWNPFANYKHIDTNCYALKTEVAIKICHAFHGGWGQDRVFYRAMEQYFPQYDCTGEYTLNYRLEGNVGSVSPEFFKFGNEQVKQKFNEFPWRQNAKDHI